ncbi:hypothetical protein HanXRQr2_Chr05g0237671 [Helianthus annuus]|uniref:Uncharacterized protein n=1 Tax=Helianthus annuus TaxID=4232 RepID=A0A9K3NQ35_HELAN|nr:hypothetical protein HanXRQr2_Chr05g0237671 [Helianthus annuus]
MVESFDGSEFLSLRGLELLEIADRMARGNLSLWAPPCYFLVLSGVQFLLFEWKLGPMAQERVGWLQIFSISF